MDWTNLLGLTLMFAMIIGGALSITGGGRSSVYNGKNASRVMFGCVLLMATALMLKFDGLLTY
jgi:hypothetical protein